MNPLIKFYSLFICIWGATFAQAAVETPLPLRVLPADAWKITAQAGDTVTLAEESGVLAVRYAVKIDRLRRVGHVSQQEGLFTLELKQPVELSPAQARIFFETRLPDTPEGVVFVRPLIEDANGEQLSYEPLPNRVFRPGKPGGWISWRSHVFNLTEAGGAAQGIYEAEGGDQNAWPDGRLRFVGFQVRVHADKGKKTAGRRSGRLVIGEVATGGVALADTPFAYADSLFEKKGDYRLAFETRVAFQGLPLKESVASLAFDPADEASRRRRIGLPLDALHNSWVRYRAVDAGGAIGTEGDFRWEQNVAPGGEASLVPVDPAKAPVIGAIRVNPLRRQNPAQVGGVYAEAEPFEVTFRVFWPEGKAQTGWRLNWTLLPYAFETVLGRGTEPVAGGSLGYADLAVTLPRQAGRDAYKVRYTLVDAAGKTIDGGDYVTGIAPATVAAYGSRPGALRTRAEIKKRPYFRTTFLAVGDKPGSEEAAAANFSAMLGESAQLAGHITYMLDLAELEVLPGVYDFRLLDQAMDVAADNGCGITVRLAHAEARTSYRWQPYTTPRSFDGVALPGHPYYGSYAIGDPEYVASWHRAFRAIHDRYAKHPGFEGYFIMQAGGEWTIPDEPWNGYIADYSWAAAQAFRIYLQEELKLDLAGLNARWGASYQTWTEVLPPQPDLASGSAPDLRPAWLDFNRCKLSRKAAWFVDMAEGIRAYDPDRIIIAYGGRDSVKKLSGLLDYFHNGGNHFLDGEGLLVDAWETNRLGWITEPHHPHRWAAYGDPAERGWVLDWSVYVMTAQAGAGGANLHVYYIPNPTYDLAAHYGGAFALDRFEMFKPILRELHGSKLVETRKQVAVIQDVDTLLAKHRTTFIARQADLRRWFELLKQDSVDFEAYQPENEAAYKLLVVNPLDEVLSQARIDTVGRMARNGAWVVISARSGRYSSDRPGAEYPLLREFGISPPRGKFETNQGGVAARYADGQSLGGRTTLPFFSQADLRTELQDPKIGADFFRWPYRWIPQSDYFGYYKGNTDTGGEVLARFPDGGVAASLHPVGQGRVLVFWGTPDMKAENTRGLMAAIAERAGVINPRAGSAIPLMLEARRDDLKRQYVFLFQETAGAYVQKLPHLDDGAWFVDEMVGGTRLGTVDGKTARETGLRVTFDPGASPLKILRFIRPKATGARWLDKYAGDTEPADTGP